MEFADERDKKKKIHSNLSSNSIGLEITRVHSPATLLGTMFGSLLPQMVW